VLININEHIHRAKLNTHSGHSKQTASRLVSTREHRHLLGSHIPKKLLLSSLVSGDCSVFTQARGAASIISKGESWVPRVGSGPLSLARGGEHLSNK
jgi:hypothetical protein